MRPPVGPHPVVGVLDRLFSLDALTTAFGPPLVLHAVDDRLRRCFIRLVFSTS
ncbi:hypothetical protein AB0M45_01455 [Nocardia sp. NPDC051787]|uniref:hypothetical protein n=1 Tax=Nocardia sp. NPDC051787 TaxID=3155415 RepID=UPI003430E65D